MSKTRTTSTNPVVNVPTPTFTEASTPPFIVDPEDVGRHEEEDFLSPEDETAAITEAAMQDAVEDTAAEVLPQVTSSALSKLASAYIDTEKQLLDLYDGSHVLTVGVRLRPCLSFYPRGHAIEGVNIVTGDGARNWTSYNSVVQAENAQHLSRLVREVTALSLQRKALLAAKVARI